MDGSGLSLSLQEGFAVFKLGDLTRYISESVILGFMGGAALLLAIGQVANLLGISDKGTSRLWLTLTKGDPINTNAIAISAATIVLALILRRLVCRYRLPQMDMLAALVVVASLAFLFGWTQPDVSGKTAIAVAGTVPASLPLPHIPAINFGWIPELSSSALAIAFLGLLEALAIAKSIANHTGQKLDYNRQCLAEGIANLVGGFFRCLPGSGSCDEDVRDRNCIHRRECLAHPGTADALYSEGGACRPARADRRPFN